MPLLNRKSCATRIDELDSKIFAHIHHDARLIGSHLQGDVFTRTASYVAKMLDYFADMKMGLTSTEKQAMTAAIQRIQAVFKSLIENETKSQNLAALLLQNHSNRDKDLEEAHKKISALADEMVADLRSRKQITIPGGWKGLSGAPGHAMCYTFVIEKNRILFLIYNTGAGLPYHLPKDRSLEEYLPVMVYELPLVSDKTLSQYIAMLLRPRIIPQQSQFYSSEKFLNENNYTAEKLYTLIGKIVEFGGSRIDPTPFCKKYTHGQVSGTCAMRVLMPILHSELKGLIFSKFLFQLRLQSIIDHYRIQYGNTTLQTELVQSQLTQALEKLMRTTRKFWQRTTLKNPIINEVEVKDILELKASIDKGLADALSFYKVQEPEEKLVKEQKKFDLRCLYPIRIILPLESIDMSMALSSDKPKTKAIQDFKSNPVLFLKSQHEIMLREDRMLANHSIIYDFEELMLSIPVTEDDQFKNWETLSKPDAKIALNYLQAMLRIYGKHCSQIWGFPFAERVLAAASALVLINKIANIYFKDRAGYFEKKSSPLSRRIKSALGDHILSDPLSVSGDPRWDKRLMELRSYLNPDSERLKNGGRSKPGDRSDIMDTYETWIIENQPTQAGADLGLDKGLIPEQIQNSSLMEALMALAPKDTKKETGGPMEDARINLYKLAQGKVTPKEPKLFENLLQEFEFGGHIDECCEEYRSFLKGSFQYFVDPKCDMSAKDNQQQRLKSVFFIDDGNRDWAKRTIAGHVFKNHYCFSPGLHGSETKLQEAYGLEDPIILETLFGDMDDSPFHSPQKLSESRSYSSNQVMMHFHSNKSLKSRDASFPRYSLPFTRITRDACRPIATKDLLESNLDQITFKDLQFMIYFNFFTPSLLVQHLETHPEFSYELVKLLADGLKFHQHGHSIGVGGMYCIRQSYYLQKYIMEHPNKEKMQATFTNLKKFDRFLERNIEMREVLLGRESKALLETKGSSEKLGEQPIKQSAQDFINRNETEGQLKDLYDLYVLRSVFLDIEIFKQSPKKFSKLLTIIFARHLVGGKRSINSDAFLENEISHVLQRLLPLLKTVFENLDKEAQKQLVLKVARKALGPNQIGSRDEDTKIMMDFPEVHLHTQSGKQFLLDFSTGYIRSSDYIECSMPPQFYTREVIDFFGLQNFIVKLYFRQQPEKKERDYDTDREAKKNCWIAEFEHNNISYRIIIDAAGKTHIQREFDKKWYELQKTEEMYFDKRDHHLPVHFGERNRLWWAEIESGRTGFGDCEGFYITDRQGNYLIKVEGKLTPKRREYMLERYEHTIFELNPNGTKTGYVLISDPSSFPADIMKPFLKFEDQKFIEVWLFMDEEYQRKWQAYAARGNQKEIPPLKLKVALKRYGLEFISSELQPTSQKIDFLWGEDQNYCVCPDETPPIRGLSNPLILKHRFENKPIAFIPIQEFLIDTKPQNLEGKSITERKKMEEYKEYIEEGAYYKLILDIRHRVPESLGGLLPSLHWNYSGQEQYIHVRLDLKPDAVLKFNPKTSYECLYLAYLYLGKHDPRNAIAYLRLARKLGGLKGSKEEITLIQRIMMGIPNTLNKLEHAKAAFNDPETVAARLFAAALLVEFKQLSLDTPLFDVLESEPTHYKNNNEHYEWHLTKERNQFYQTEFEIQFFMHYQLYLKVRGNVAEDLRLPRSHELMLLRALFKNKAMLQHADRYSYGRRFRRLELIELQKKAQHLQKQMKQGKPDELSQKHLQKIAGVLKQGNAYHTIKHTVIESKQMEIVPVEVTLTWIEEYDLSNSTSNPSNFNIDSLSGETDSTSFLKNFRYLYFVARDCLKVEESKSAAEKRDTDRKKLKDYLEMQFRVEIEKRELLRIPATEPIKPILALYGLLCYVIDNPKISWPEYPKSRDDTKKFLNNLVSMCKKIHADKPSTIKISGTYARTPVLAQVYTHAKGPQEPPPHYPMNIYLKKDEIPDFCAAFDLGSFAKAHRAGIAQLPSSTVPSFSMPIPKPSVSEPSASKIALQLETKGNKEIVIAKPTAMSKVEQRKYRESFFQKEAEDFEEDLLAGKRINSMRKQQFENAINTFKSVKTRSEIATKIDNDLKKDFEFLKRDTKTHKEFLRTIDAETTYDIALLHYEKSRILQLANSILIGSKTDLRTRLKVEGLERRTLKFQDLLYLYLCNDVQMFKNKTLLNDRDILELHKSMHNYLLMATRFKHFERIKKAIAAVPKDETDPEFYPRLQILADIIAEKRNFVPEENPGLLLFEYFEQISIRENQISMLKKLVSQDETGGYPNFVTQLIMGGGKSKVLLPLLALQKATGANLSIIEVPQALFETNLADLRNTTERCFGKQAHPFVFSRDSHCDPETLQALYKKLQQIMVDKEFIVTTAESIQALELKYWELMECAPKAPDVTATVSELANYQTRFNEWTTQLQNLEKILKLFKKHGDALIDEIDSGLDTKKELNYTIGDSQAIDEERLQLVLDIFNLFPEVKFALDGKTTTLEQVMLGKVTLSKEADWQTLFKALSSVLAEHPQSPINRLPLSQYTAKFSKEEKEELSLYLYHDFLDETDSKPRPVIKMPKFITTLKDEKEKARIGLIKGELEFLKLTLKRKAHEHYGFPSTAKYVGSVDVAIPYIANNTPCERAQFGSFYETINYSLQLHLQNGELSTTILQEFLQEFHKRANLEVIQFMGDLAFEDTKASREFFALTGTHLSTAQPTDDLTHFKKLWAEKRAARDYCLLHYVLKKIKHDPTILRSNAVNHASVYRSRQGFTGTPWNYRCYHPDMKFNKEDSLGTDGQTIDHVLSKNTKVFTAPTKNPGDLVRTILNRDLAASKIDQSKRVHAIIDVGALFKGKKNDEIVHLIVLNLLLQKRNDLRYVLYFDENNDLSAFPVNILEKLDESYRKKIAAQTLNEADIKQLLEVEFKKIKPKVIGTSDAERIQAETGCTPSQFFTYYDQRHTTGTDIKQPLNSIGVVTVDVDTGARGFVQGGMRMRDLPRTQDIEVMLSQGMNNGSETKIDAVIDRLLQNQWQQLGEYHFQSALQKMHNVVREDFKKRIYAVKDVSQKIKLYQIFRDQFMTQILNDPFLQFANIEQFPLTRDILQGYANTSIQNWQKAMATARIEYSHNDFIILQKTINNIAKDSADYCLERRKHMPRQEEDSIVQIQREKEREREREMRPEVEIMINPGQGKPRAAWRHSWHTIPFVPFMGRDRSGEDLLALNKMLATSALKPEFDFQDNILVSNNFAETYMDQTDQMAVKKPLNFVLYVQTPEKLQAILLTPEDAHEFSDLINANRERFSNTGYGAWVVSTHGTFRAGTSPTIEHPDYQKLQGQISLFNADLDILSKNLDGLLWFTDKMPEKLKYLDKLGLESYPEKRSMLNGFRESIGSIETRRKLQESILKPDHAAIANVIKAIAELRDPVQETSLLNSRSSKGISFLSLAIQMRDSKSAEILLNTGKMELVRPDDRKFIPLSYALINEDEAMIQRLSKQLPSSSETNTWTMLLGLAAKCKKKTIFEQFYQHVKSMQDPDRKDILNSAPVGLSDYPFLYYLIEQGKIDYIRLILKDNLINTRLHGNLPTLDFAFKCNNKEIIDLLLEDLRFIPEQNDKLGWVKLIELAIDAKNEQVLHRLLEDKRSCPDPKDHKIWSDFLHATIKNHDLNCMKTLLAKLKKSVPIVTRRKVFFNENEVNSLFEQSIKILQKLMTERELDRTGYYEDEEDETEAGPVTSTHLETKGQAEVPQNVSPLSRKSLEITHATEISLLLLEHSVFTPLMKNITEWGLHWWNILNYSRAKTFASLKQILELLPISERQEVLNSTFSDQRDTDDGKTKTYAGPNFLALVHILEGEKAIEAIQYFLLPKNGVNILAVDSDGCNILHHAIQELDVDILKLLLQDKRFNLKENPNTVPKVMMELIQSMAKNTYMLDAAQEFMEFILTQDLDFQIKINEKGTFIDNLDAVKFDSKHEGKLERKFNELKKEWIRKIELKGAKKDTSEVPSNGAPKSASKDIPKEAPKIASNEASRVRFI